MHKNRHNHKSNHTVLFPIPYSCYRILGCGIDGVAKVISVLADCKPANINKLLSTENWQTLLMLAREASQFGDMDNDLEMDDDISEAIKRSLADR